MAYSGYHHDFTHDGQRFRLIEPPGASTVGTAPMIVVSDRLRDE